MIKPGKVRISYLLQESIIFLGLSYLFFAGGTYNGNILFMLHETNFILGGLAVLFWLAWRIFRKRPFPFTPLDWPLLGWLAMVALSTLTSVDPRLSLEYLNPFLVFSLIFYMVVDLVRAGWPEELWIKTLLSSSLLILCFGIYQAASWYMGWFEIGGWSHLLSPSTLRVGSTLSHPNIFAAFLNLLLPLGLVKIITSPRKSTRILLGIWAIVVLVMIILTSSRGGYLATMASLGIFALLTFIEHRKKVKQAWQWFIQHRIISLSLAVILLVSLAGAGALLMRQLNHPSHVPAANSRGYIWKVAFDMFRQHPLWGTGPGTFGFSFISAYSIPPNVLLGHAHNFLFNNLAESGLLGALSLLILTVFIGVAAIRYWRNSLSDHRVMMAGILASLGGLAIHSLFDTPETMNAINMIAAIVLAILIASTPGPVKQVIRGKNWLASLPFIVTGLLASLIAGYSLYGYSAYIRAKYAADSQDWQTAAQLMDEAVRRDPWNRFYGFQKGFIYGRLALNQDGGVRDSRALRVALDSYESSVSQAKEYSVNWANLAILRQATGDRQGALAAMQEAANRAPKSPILWLNLGKMAEQDGYSTQAREAYLHAVTLSPIWSETDFFRPDGLLREVIENETTPAKDPGYQALDNADYASAAAIFRSRLGVNTADAYRGLGIALAGMGYSQESTYAMQTADFIDGGPIEARLIEWRYFQKLGEPDRSNQYYLLARSLLKNSSSFGPGTLGEQPYAWYIFRREAIILDLLPGLEVSPPLVLRDIDMK